jgi:hypothetical protein
VVAFTLLYSWLLIHRVRLARMEEVAEYRRLEEALAERRAEGAGGADGAEPSEAAGVAGVVR